MRNNPGSPGYESPHALVTRKLRKNRRGSIGAAAGLAFMAIVSNLSCVGKYDFPDPPTDDCGRLGSLNGWECENLGGDSVRVTGSNVTGIKCENKERARFSAVIDVTKYPSDIEVASNTSNWEKACLGPPNAKTKKRPWIVTGAGTEKSFSPKGALDLSLRAAGAS